MKQLLNIKKALLEIGTILASNETICKLVYNDNANALNMPTPMIDLNQLINEHYITIYPPVESGIKDNDRNTFIILLLDSVNLHTTDNNIKAHISLYVTTDANHILLTKNQNRLLELADAVIEALDNIKLSSAGELHVTGMVHTMINTFRAGYNIRLNLTDQQNQKAEI